MVISILKSRRWDSLVPTPIYFLAGNGTLNSALILIKLKKAFILSGIKEKALKMPDRLF